MSRCGWTTTPASARLRVTPRPGRTAPRFAFDATEHLLDRPDIACGGDVDELAHDQPQLIGRAAVRLPALALELEQDGLAQQSAGLAGFGLLVGRGHDASCSLKALVKGSEV